MKTMIATWPMSLQAVRKAYAELSAGGTAGDAVCGAVAAVEDEPAYLSVGYGALPDLEGHVKLDAAYMDGRTLRMGAVMSVENVRNPILLARHLCGRRTNFLLAGRGAEEEALRAGLEIRDMRTENAMRRWREEISRMPEKLKAYEGHDTVCVLALDDKGDMVAGTSTSGLFLKAPGRVGDSPVVGSGFYCDARYGAAAATGLGEDVMRGCLSYEIVSQLRRGMDPKQACESAVRALYEKLFEQGETADNVSVIALAPDGRWAAATTKDVFEFSVGEGDGVALWAATCRGDAFRPADERR